MDDSTLAELLDRRRAASRTAAPGSKLGANFRPGMGTSVAADAEATHAYFGLCPPGTEQMVTFRLREGRQHLSLNYGHMLQCYWASSGKAQPEATTGGQSSSSGVLPAPTPAQPTAASPANMNPLARVVRAVSLFSSPKPALVVEPAPSSTSSPAAKGSPVHSSTPPASPEYIKVTFTAGWEIRVLGRGLEPLHRALVSRSLSWLRAAFPEETDRRDAPTFIQELQLVRSNVGESRPAATPR